jgi:hypothetical protein
MICDKSLHLKNSMQKNHIYNPNRSVYMVFLNI